MAEILGDRAYKAAKKQTMKKLSLLRQVILEASKRPSRSPEAEELRIEVSSPQKRK